MIYSFNSTTILAQQHPAAEADNIRPVYTASSQSIRVMSFNIRYGSAKDGKNSWQHRHSQVIGVLKDYKADIIGLQEALRFQLEEIKTEMSGYAQIGVGRDDGDTSGEYSPILYKRDRFTIGESGTLWFSETPLIPGSKHWGNKYPRIFTFVSLTDRTSGKKILVYNLHLDHANLNSRWKSVSLINRHIAENKTENSSVILLGDFNSGENSAVIKYILGKENFLKSKDTCRKNPLPMKDSFRSIHPKDRGGTFHMFWGKNFGPKFDYIFVSPDISVKEAAIIRSNIKGRFPSDHFPITADIEISEHVNDFM
ncbi:MAG: endonuclease/exonuclease/phosphatase family protein [Chitinispirillales bacterium]|jgi:endonuclease/exonuclease/phosphatase family metal-dependent hydrolase|nr:endonuclease/exonuclease/phosphatase family protein [Chitinispirillales bacterium]